MNFNEETYWKVQDYINGKLKGIELMEFEHQIFSDPNLQGEIELQKLADQLILANRILSASQVSLKTINSLKKKELLNRVISIGTIALLSIGILSYYLYPNKSIHLSKSNLRKGKPVVTENPSKLQEQRIQKPISKPEPVNNKSEEKVNIQSLKVSSAKVDTVKRSSGTPPALIKIESLQPEIPLSPQKSEKAVIIDHCQDLKITAPIEVKNSCQNEDNGHIYVNGFEGGTSPYSYKVLSLKDNKHFAPSNLPAGFYNVIIYDQHNCSVIYSNISVKEIACSQPEKSFNPFIGEILELGEMHQNGILIINSKDGEIHYSKNFLKNENLQWNGISNNGETESGYYIYSINYKDGTSFNGEVTVTK